MSVALLAGGTGGGKLAAGLQELLGDELAVIVNTATTSSSRVSTSASTPTSSPTGSPA